MICFQDILNEILKPQYRDGCLWIPHHININPKEYEVWLNPDIHYAKANGFEVSIVQTNHVKKWSVNYIAVKKMTHQQIAQAIYERDGCKNQRILRRKQNNDNI